MEKFVVPEGDEEDLSIPEPTRIAIVDPVSKDGPGMDEDLLTEDWSESDTAPVLPQDETDDIGQPPDISTPIPKPSMPVMPTVSSPTSPVANSPEQETQVAANPFAADGPKPVTAPPAEAFTNVASTGLPKLPGTTQTVQPNVQQTPQPSIPIMPAAPASVSQPATPSTTSSVTMPNLPTASTAPSPTIPATTPPLWPWPQAEAWDDRLLAGKVKNAMEAAKMNRKEEAAAILDEIGPHLGDRTRLMLYIGALLKSPGVQMLYLLCLRLPEKITQMMNMSLLPSNS